MPLILQKWIKREDLRANPEAFYAFGDNTERWGLGGQAREMRGEPNAVGISTLAAPGRYWSDAEYAENCAVIDADIKPLFDALAGRRLVVFPLDGVGTGLANLEQVAPRTFAHLTKQISRLKQMGKA